MTKAWKDWAAFDDKPNGRFFVHRRSKASMAKGGASLSGRIKKSAIMRKKAEEKRK